MRKEPFFVGDIVHVFNCGNRKQNIVLDKEDKINFLLGLRYLNNKGSISSPLARVREFLKTPHLRFDLKSGVRLEWLPMWDKQDALVEILAFTLMDNHLHLVLREIREGGISEFMRKMSNSMTGYFNERHEVTGRLFQGPYKARRVNKDNYMQYLMVYVHIKNVFELYPGGLENAMNNFDDAFEFALKYPYSSLGGYFSDDVASAQIITGDRDIVLQTMGNKEEFKGFAKNCLEFVYFDEAKNLIKTTS